MTSTHEIILDFIQQFADFGPDIDNCFSNGMCYWFAHILQARFADEDPYIMYAPVSNHFYCKINHKYYDITGECIPNEAIYFWLDYDRVDYLEASRIIRDCVDKCPAGVHLCGHCDKGFYDDWGTLICTVDNSARGYNQPCKGGVYETMR